MEESWETWLYNLDLPGSRTQVIITCTPDKEYKTREYVIILQQALSRFNKIYKPRQCDGVNLLFDICTL